MKPNKFSVLKSSDGKPLSIRGELGKETIIAQMTQCKNNGSVWKTDLIASIEKIFSLSKFLEECSKHHYKIISEIGQGATATVISYLDEKGNERVFKDFKEKNAFQKELEAVNLLDQRLGSAAPKVFNMPVKYIPGLMSMPMADAVFDSKDFIQKDVEPGEEDTRPPSSDADSRIDDIGFFKRMARKLLKKLKTLHDKDLVHGDVKPDNIHALHGDKFVFADVGTVHDVSVKTMGGSPNYNHPDMSEALNAACTPDRMKKNDVYGVGCSMLDLLLGKRPGKARYYTISTSPEYREEVIKEIKRRFTHKTMHDDRNIEQLLNFISRLCAPKIDAVPTAEEALKDPFCAK